MLVSFLSFLLFLVAVGGAEGSPADSSASNLRRGAAGDVPEGPLDQDGRELNCRAPFACTPYLAFATVPGAACNAELYPYATVTSDPVCNVMEPTVIQLAGVSDCVDTIASVQFVLKDGTGKVLRQFTETSAPYTLFGDNPVTNTFNSKVLAAGQYTLSVLIRTSARCTLWSGTIPFTVAPEPCPEDCADTSYYSSHLYRPVATTMNWQQADCYTMTRPKCCGARPHLLTVEDSNEFTFVTSTFYQPSLGQNAPLPGGTSWLGLTDFAQAFSFDWVTGVPLGAFHPWGTLQPDDSGGNERCVLAFLNNGGFWYDVNCGAISSGFIMEYECTVG